MFQADHGVPDVAQRTIRTYLKDGGLVGDENLLLVACLHSAIVVIAISN